MNAVGRTLLTQASAILGVGLVVAGLWAFGAAESWARTAGQEQIALWAMRCSGVALVGLGQVAFALGVLPGFFGLAGQSGLAGRGLEVGYAAAAGLVALLAGVAAVALMAAGW